jgi:predicted SprT family Zn-dependent metalloprotease
MSVSYDTKKPTAEYAALQEAFDHFNATLFNGQLPDCLITLQRKKGARGYFWGAIFAARADDSTTDEIALNPETFNRTDIEILSTLAHEMCHVWQHHHGKPTRSGYHNREWAAKMRAIGLIPSHTGQPGGKPTGQRVTHYIDPDGPFAHHAADLISAGFTLRWQSRGRASEGAATTKNKVKYSCPTCGQKAWAKPDSKLICGTCEQRMEEATSC